MKTKPASIFAEFEPPDPMFPPQRGPAPQPPKPMKPVDRRQASYWTLPEIDAALADLESERSEQWDLLIPEAVLAAARLLPADELPAVADYLHGRLTALRQRIVEERRAG
jgi:hypothetical protein